MPLTDWTRVFAKLSTDGYTRTSDATPDYNCIAWAAGDNTQWWEPDTSNLGYWPPGVERKRTVRAYRAAFAAIGYAPCRMPDLESGYEKIAIYVSNNPKIPQHAARQLPNGKWTSKLGFGDDIEHTLDSLNGGMYGTHSIYMKRRVP